MREDQSYRIKNNIGERKIMKTKSLFISTIAMVVMLIVALSVGTFAWYTAQNVVEAKNASVGALETDSSAIGLGWAQETAIAPNITLGAGEVRPMIPKTMPADNNIPVFNEALLGTDTNNVYIVKSQTNADPWIEQGQEPESQNAVWIGNLDATLGARITTKVTVNPVNDTNLNELLRVSVFVKESEELTKYIGTWIGGGTAYYADLSATSGDPAEPVYVGKNPELIKAEENEFTASITSGIESEITFDLANSASEDQPAQKQIYIRAWLEGTELDNTNMDLADAGFTVTFTATKISSDT